MMYEDIIMHIKCNNIRICSNKLKSENNMNYVLYSTIIKYYSPTKLINVICIQITYQREVYYPLLYLKYVPMYLH